MHTVQNDLQVDELTLDAVVSNVNTLNTSLAVLNGKANTLDGEITQLQRDLGFVRTFTQLVIDRIAHDEDVLVELLACCTHHEVQLQMLDTELAVLSTMQEEIAGINDRLINAEQDIQYTGSIMSALEQEVDELQALVGSSCEETVADNLIFDHQSQLQEGSALIFQFSACRSLETPTLLFKKNTIVTIPENARLVFRGEGRVILEDGVQFVFTGSTADHSSVMVIEKDCAMQPDTNATIMMEGKGTLLVRDGGKIALNDASHLWFGNQATDTLTLQLARFGTLEVNDDHASIAFRSGVFDIIADQVGIITINRGKVCFNTPGMQGHVRRFAFLNSSILQTNTGQLLLNDNIDDQLTDCDTTGAIMRGLRGICYKPSQSSIDLQQNAVKGSMSILQLFMQLGYLYHDERPGSWIMVNVNEQPAALRAVRDGSTVLLQDGDHDLWYGNANDIYGNANDIYGYDITNRPFKIDSKNIRTNQ